MYTQAASHDFPGLDLRAAVDDQGCIDCLNVDFDRQGAVRVRDGYDNFTPTGTPGAERYFALAPFYESVIMGGSRQLVTCRDNGTTQTVQTLNTSGSSVATHNAGDYLDGPLVRAAFVRFAAPNSELMYVALGDTQGGLRVPATAPVLYKWNSTAFTAITTLNLNINAPALVGLMPTDNRLALYDHPRAGTAYSRVWFSDAGAPETFANNNYVELTPGDGEEVWAMPTWQDQLFVFKESKFFVFYGNSVDASGNPQFNYRPISSGVGCVGSRAFAVAPEGVYFCSRDGIYITTGGMPTRISDPVEPIFTGATSSFFQSSALNQGQTSLVAMTYLNGRVYVAFPSDSATANDRTLVYDTKTEKWTLWSLAAGALSTFRRSEAEELVFAYASGSNHIGYQLSTHTTDDGTAIVSRYRTGFTDFGTDTEKKIAAMRLFGTGSVDVQLSKDFGALSTAKTATLGTNPAIAQARVDGNVRDGRLWSWQFGKSSGQWTVYRAHMELDPPQVPDTKT